jgi:hypothetical protein
MWTGPRATMRHPGAAFRQRVRAVRVCGAPHRECVVALFTTVRVRRGVYEGVGICLASGDAQCGDPGDDVAELCSLDAQWATWVVMDVALWCGVVEGAVQDAGDEGQQLQFGVEQHVDVSVADCLNGPFVRFVRCGARRYVAVLGHNDGTEFEARYDTPRIVVLAAVVSCGGRLVGGLTMVTDVTDRTGVLLTSRSGSTRTCSAMRIEVFAGSRAMNAANSPAVPSSTGP